MQRQQLVQRPAMICEPRRHGRRRLLCLGQTRMRRTKVIDRADQELGAFGHSDIFRNRC
jgi:hypothetical protein